MWGLTIFSSAISAALPSARRARRLGPRKGAEHALGVRHPGRRLQRAHQARAAAMSLAVEEEQVLPGLALDRAGLDRGEVEALLREGRQQPVQRARLVLADREEQAGGIVPGGRRLQAPDHGEAGGVVAAVL